MEQEKTGGIFVEMDAEYLMEFFGIPSRRLAENVPELGWQVQDITLPEIHLMSDDLRALEAENEQLADENEQLKQRIKELEEAQKKKG